MYKIVTKQTINIILQKDPEDSLPKDNLMRYTEGTLEVSRGTQI